MLQACYGAAPGSRRMTGVPIFGRESDLPSRVGGLARFALEVYPDRRAGVAIRYRFPKAFAERLIRESQAEWRFSHLFQRPDLDLSQFKADVFLYDLGVDVAPLVVTSPATAAALKHALNELATMVEIGRYEQLEVLSTQFLTVPPAGGPPGWLWAVVRYRQAAGPSVDHTLDRISHIAIRPAGSFFNKVRFTYPAHFDERVGFSMLTAFLEDWQSAVELHLTGDSTDPSSARLRRRAWATDDRPGPPHPLGYMDVERAQARQDALLRHYMDFQATVSEEPAYAERGARDHELGHLLYAALGRDMALSLDHGGAARRIDMRQPPTGEPA